MTLCHIDIEHFEIFKVTFKIVAKYILFLNLT